MSSTVVAIDGPAGAGKSTVARLLAERMGFAYINTGSLYRALALAALREKAETSPVSGAFLAAQHLEFRGADLYWNGQRMGEELRTPECAALASAVAKQPAVREYLLAVQRDSAKHGWIVMEGRDIGTVIFPDAACKFFVTASIEERARRRMQQAGEVSSSATLAKVAAEIAARDEQDSKRQTAPLKPAPDSLIVDTTGMTIEAVVDFLARKVQEKM